MKNIVSFETEIDNRMTELLGILAGTAAKGNSIDSLFHIQWFNFDVVGRLCFGQPFSFLQQERDVNDLIEEFAQTTWILEILAVQENLFCFDSSQAGSETTSLNLAQIIFYIARDSGTQERLQDELDASQIADLVPSLAETKNYEKESQLPFLNACVRETLRYAPSIVQLPREPPASMSLQLHGKFMPPRTSVSASAWIIGHNKNLYGDDTDVYRPERWLEASPDQLKRMTKLDFTLGYGARGYLGRHLALIQLFKATAEIFCQFDVEVAKPNNLQPRGTPLNW
ncbi:MAG: hypothetical protein M1834_009550 [Cirrosporium novae-zelandiae]|nr:MAG: hypothetical protein M1834_009550 [Cirrosporium novae-zelandiae]